MAGDKQRVRTISSLTQEQIDRKRDTDRKAQRALRLRTNSRITALERELELLKASHSQETDSNTAEINALRQANESLQQQLHLLETGTGTENQSDRAYGRPSPERYNEQIGDHQETPNLDLHNSLSSHTDVLSSVDVTASSSELPSHNVESRLQEEYQSYSPSSCAHTSLVTIPHDEPSQFHSSAVHYISPARKPSYSTGNVTETDDYLDGMLGDDRSYSTSPSTITVNSPSSFADSRLPETPIMKPTAVWNILPRHSPATCPLDHILLDYLSSRRILKARGEPRSSIIGPSVPSISGLLLPNVTTKHPASRVMVDIVATFKDVNIQEKLAFLYIMYATTRWQIACCKESFDQIPRWLQPTILQVIIPHAAWVENIPWPGMRDMLIQHPTKYPFEEFSEMYSRNVKLTWPHEPLDAVMQITVNEEEFVFNPLFEKHIRKLSSWSMGEPFKKQYPEFVPIILDSQLNKEL